MSTIPLGACAVDLRCSKRPCIETVVVGKGTTQLRQLQQETYVVDMAPTKSHWCPVT